MVDIVVTPDIAPEAWEAGAAPVMAVDNFLPVALAEAMRREIDAHFADPHAHKADTHQVWNYWFVPGHFTYLRAAPQKIIARPHIQTFLETLRHWSLETLGMGTVTWPYLSLYIPGCLQGWHNDSLNGQFGFVYSLTRDDRRTTGGETLVMRDEDALRSHLTRPAAGRNFYEAVAPKFNRLVVFDDRIPHAVARIEGSMDPAEGRFVLHGHLSEGGMAATGALPKDAVTAPLEDAVRAYTAKAGQALAPFHGPLSLRLTIDAAGAVTGCGVLLDRVLHPDAADESWDDLRARLLSDLAAPRFPASSGETAVILPLLFGGRPARSQ